MSLLDIFKRQTGFHDAIFICDPGGIVQSCSPEAERLIGKLTQGPGKKIRDALAGAGLTLSNLDRIEGALAQGESLAGYDGILSAGPDQIELHVSVTPLLNRREGASLLAVTFTMANQSEETFTQQEATLRSFYESAPMLMGVVELTENDQIVYIYSNPATARFVKVRRDEMIGKQTDELGFPAEATRDWVALFRQSQKLGQPVSFEYEFPPPQGPAWFSATVAAIGPGPSGRMQFSFVGEDITKRKQSKARLMESEARLRGIFESAAIGIGLVDLNGRLMSANPKMLEMLGYCAEELMGMHIEDVSHPEDYIVDKRLVHELFTGERDHYQMEKRYRRKDGRIIWGRLTGSLVRTHEGQPLYALGMVEDIDEQKRVQKALQSSEERYREMLETVQLVAVMLDTEARILFLNDFALKLTGWSREEAIRQKWQDLFIPPEEREKLQEAFHLGITEKMFFPHYENEILTKSGERRRLIWDNTLLRDPDGRVIGTASLGRDITDQKILEEQLRQAQKMEAIGTLAGGIAHDFNNILSPIFGYSDMLLSRLENDEEGIGYIDGILAASQRAKELVQQILFFSRHSENKKEAVQLHPVIQEIIRFLRATLPSSIDISYSFENNDDAVLADRTQIHQVIMNLCTNAYQAMPQGGVLSIQLQTVNLDAEQSRMLANLQPGSYVRLSVIDNGHGMDEGEKNRIFEPFYTTKPVGEGTGLGLSVVHGIVMDSGGAIQVRSEPNQGSTFDVYLPRYDQVPQAEKAGPPTKGKGRILFVDDDPAVAMMIKKMVEGLGYQVTVISDGAAALEVFSATPAEYDLVFTDQTMPGMIGLDLCRRINEIRPGIPVVLYTGIEASSVADTEAGAGPDMILKKPMRLGALSRAIDQALSRGQQ